MDLKTLDKRYEFIAWGCLFLWIGVRDLIPGLPNGSGLLGIGLILLGLNMARTLSRIPMRGFSLTLGFLASVSSAVILSRPALHFPPIELPFFPILLFLMGYYMLFHVPSQTEKQA